MGLLNNCITEIQSTFHLTLNQLELLCLRNELEDLFNNHQQILVLNALDEVFDRVLRLHFYALLIVLDDKRRIQDLLVLVSEQVEKQIAWNAQIELLL